MTDALPDFVAPMLAQIGEPFDSDEHLFEIKWDGTRCLTFLDGGAQAPRLRNRRDNDLAMRYPELAFLADLPAGAVLDGEIVVLRDGQADFPALLSREQARTPERAAQLAGTTPATYAVFDQLYAGHRSIMNRPLLERRASLRELVEGCGDARLVFSDGVRGGGIAYFDEVCGLGIEGVVAKRIDSRYLSGRRTGAWLKLKPVQRLHCVILGFVPDGPRDVKSLIIGSDPGDGLRCVGKVGSGLTDDLRRRLRTELEPRVVGRPLVPCPGMSAAKSRWVEPGLYCVVSFVEITARGNLRAPVFIELLTD